MSQCHPDHSSCCSNQQSCGHQAFKASCCCHQKSYGCASSHESTGKCDHMTKFFELADQAWMELLKEKIKEHILSHSKEMDELARVIAEANQARWEKKIEDRQLYAGFEERIKALFGKSCCNQGQRK
jgi:hypothetical protein